MLIVSNSTIKCDFPEPKLIIIIFFFYFKIVQLFENIIILLYYRWTLQTELFFIYNEQLLRVILLNNCWLQMKNKSKRLNDFEIKEKIIADHQFGFRKN